MKIYPDTKIYMVCPANIHSGGPELCHQLVSQLVQFGVNAYIFYLEADRGNFNSENPVDDFYKKYHCPYVLQIEDEPQNILIMNETGNWLYSAFKNVRKIFWWMSVDNYLQNMSTFFSQRMANPLAEPMPKFFYFQNDETEHWVQSEYARQFLELNGVPATKVYSVEDYLNQTFWINAGNIDLSEKQDIIVFNPLKGLDVTKKLVDMGPNIYWAPIRNMTPAEVQDLLAASKVYIDFGNHPGKDRIPREAALSGCVVITGKRGAAANDIDINIPDEFKFGETDEDLPRIMEKIFDVFENFGVNYLKQEEYRKRILDDKARFAREVAAAFNITPPERQPFAVVQGLSEKGLNFINMLLTQNIIPNFIIDDTFCDMRNFEDNGVIKTSNNTNYFILPNLPGYGIMIISSEDAKFLYNEGRIKKFALLTPTDEEIESAFETFDPAREDLLVFNPN